ncbi:hypothetical protein DSO57_1018436 [Entomophthora muscae]|uniref:Uncharacterized protein n=1 Tax=Entomophthora muscae TaxID=34485 RepID=A0ACC2UE04_9FUNG|nr:hypothetical protein DSO57_1018436 [Entomophthora muscae]
MERFGFPDLASISFRSSSLIFSTSKDSKKAMEAYKDPDKVLELANNPILEVDRPADQLHMSPDSVNLGTGIELEAAESDQLQLLDLKDTVASSGGKLTGKFLSLGSQPQPYNPSGSMETLSINHKL